MKNKLLVTILIIFCICCKTTHVSKLNTCWGNERDMYYVISATGIDVPLNRLVLIKKHEKIGAFKFTYYEEEKAEYEWFYPLQHGLEKDKVKRGKGRLSDRFFPIIGRLALQLGRTEIKCGPLRLDWPGRNIVSFFDSSTAGWESSIQLAPTKKEDISEINLDDPELHWYKYDEKRKDIGIPLSSL